jgi:vacuolar protein sorting-associated protein 45
MDVVQTISGYISKMIAAGDGSTGNNGSAKMKILLLDPDTVSS